MTTASGHTSAITATKVIGTPVRDLSGRKIGHIEDIVLDKLSNNVLFAVVGFGGFLDITEKFHLQAAPADSLEALTEGDAMAFRNRAIDYYYAPGPA